MEVLIENIIVYTLVGMVIVLVMIIYLRASKNKSNITESKFQKAQQLGFHEPVSLHPVIDPDICIGSGACVAACPEKDILGLANGRAQTVNASRCIGHGACFHACPVQAISLCIGTEKRGVELPHISPEFETSIAGIFIAGELGGMGLIKNAVEQGKQATEYLIKKLNRNVKAQYDVIIVGSGPAGISATLTAARAGIKFLTLEQDTLGGTVYTFPRAKVVMTSPMDLPLYGKIKLTETTKSELLELWMDVLKKNNISINEQEKVLSIEKQNDLFIVKTDKDHYTSRTVLLAIGRRGTPRKLGVPGENKEKVSYRLLEPELIKNRNVLIVGGGDSAIESAVLLADEGNEVNLSYRGNSFSRVKPGNLDIITEYEKLGKIRILFNTIVTEIRDDEVILKNSSDDSEIKFKNDLVYIFAGGELPTKFLEKIGIRITKKFGDPILKHER